MTITPSGEGPQPEPGESYTPSLRTPHFIFAYCMILLCALSHVSCISEYIGNSVSAMVESNPFSVLKVFRCFRARLVLLALMAFLLLVLPAMCFGSPPEKAKSTTVVHAYPTRIATYVSPSPASVTHMIIIRFRGRKIITKNKDFLPMVLVPVQSRSWRVASIRMLLSEN